MLLLVHMEYDFPQGQPTFEMLTTKTKYRVELSSKHTDMRFFQGPSNSPRADAREHPLPRQCLVRN